MLSLPKDLVALLLMSVIPALWMLLAGLVAVEVFVVAMWLVLSGLGL